MTVNGYEHSYSYDKIYQLTDVVYPENFFAPDTTFGYDPAGNRVFVDDPGRTVYTPNILNQYSSVGATTYAYDENGNLTDDGTYTYTYDAQNRLTTATNQSTSLSTTYTYDPQGRRISKDVGGTVTKYVYDGDQVICEYDGSGQLKRKFLYGTGIDEPVRMTTYKPSTDINPNSPDESV